MRTPWSSGGVAKERGPRAALRRESMRSSSIREWKRAGSHFDVGLEKLNEGPPTRPSGTSTEDAHVRSCGGALADVEQYWEVVQALDARSSASEGDQRPKGAPIQTGRMLTLARHCQPRAGRDATLDAFLEPSAHTLVHRVPPAERELAERSARCTHPHAQTEVREMLAGDRAAGELRAEEKKAGGRPKPGTRAAWRSQKEE